MHDPATRKRRSRKRGALAPGKLAAAADRRRVTRQLRALAHPLRLRLLQAFARGRRTTMQVATQLGEPPTRLYHHVNALERAGILKLVDTRQVRGTTEKYFEVAHRQIGHVRGQHLTKATRASLTGIATVVFEEAKAELLAVMADPTTLTRATAPVVLRMLLTLPASTLPRVRRRLLATLKAIQRESRKGKRRSPTARQWALTMAFTPTMTRGK